jgi:tetratricopeptide (TPR) repeat protein
MPNSNLTAFISMVASDIDLSGPPARRIHPLIWWLGACFAAWGLVGYFFYSLVPIVQCFGEADDKSRVTCAAALEHALVKGKFRQAILRKQIDHLMAMEKYAEALQVSDDVFAAGQPGSADYVMRGQVLAAESKHEAAAAAYRMALRMDPGDEIIFGSLMSASIDASTYDDARRDAGAFIRHHRASATGYSWLGWADYLDGRYASASPNLRVAAKLLPQDAWQQNVLGQSLEREGKNNEALESYGKAIALDDGHSSEYLENRAVLYRDLGREADAQADFRKSLRIYRSTTAILGLAKSYINEDKYGIAEPLVREALAREPDNEEAHISEIRLHYFREDYPRARQAIAALRKVTPESVDADYWQASVDDDEGKSEAALKGYQSVLDDWPDNVQLRVDIGHVLIDLGRSEEAIASFSAALALDPEQPKAFGGLARAYGRLKSWRDAIAVADKAIALDGKNGVYYGRRAIAFWGMRDMAAARKDFEAVATFAPDIKWLAEEHVKFLIEEGAWAAAAEKIDTLAAKWPQNSKVRELKNELESAKALAVRVVE